MFHLTRKIPSSFSVNCLIVFLNAKQSLRSVFQNCFINFKVLGKKNKLTIEMFQIGVKFQFYKKARKK